ncbi:UDP-N-acetylmuramoyl-tripeptide--D-alanyl-D-alanine ligase [Sphingobacterium sp. Mn56C]|uniref:UDP-N-acetylmuramoyl-tripeptide--D-alanyl-D- alanine ligase n=1 Tax=Sphingobacterium sp. Mn56C TaxID=3395261 RepID=UPI003BCEF385
MQIEALYEIFLQHPVISTDTRSIKKDSLFFALKGDNFNGNAFAAQALANGAKYVVVDEEHMAVDDRYIYVNDVLTALQDLARFHRQQLNIPVVGITGTNGKTTSKELLYAVLSQRYKTFATQGNLNNHIGVPLTLLAIDSSIEIAIIEMGANHVGEIALLARIAQPTCGLITNVGKAHLEGFGSFDGVKRAKGELYDYLQDHKGTLFLQGDNPYLIEMFNQRSINKVLRYGFSEDNDIIGSLLIADPYLSISWHQKDSATAYTVRTNLTGSYNIENFLAAIAVGLFFDIDPERINKGIAAYIPQNNRSQITHTSRNTVVADFYNANASSMAAALDNIRVLTADHKVVVLGDMFEMGDEAFIEHQRIIELATTIPLDRLIFVGREFFKQRSEKAEFYETTDDALIQLKDINNAFILLKASRGMAFEKILEIL